MHLVYLNIKSDVECHFAISSEQQIKYNSNHSDSIPNRCTFWINSYTSASQMPANNNNTFITIHHRHHHHHQHRFHLGHLSTECWWFVFVWIDFLWCFVQWVFSSSVLCVLVHTMWFIWCISRPNNREMRIGRLFCIFVGTFHLRALAIKHRIQALKQPVAALSQ